MLLYLTNQLCENLKNYYGNYEDMVALRKTMSVLMNTETKGQVNSLILHRCCPNLILYAESILKSHNQIPEEHKDGRIWFRNQQNSKLIQPTVLKRRTKMTRKQRVTILLRYPKLIIPLIKFW